jgi:probable rRNA maturation factor
MVEVIIYDNMNPGLDSDFFLLIAETVVVAEGMSLGPISLVFGSDMWLYEYNVAYLNHDYYTDIITFDYCTNDLVSGDLLISLERVLENSAIEGVSRETEVKRVVIHGLLHLCGYGDKSEDESRLMREKEDYYLLML